MSQLNIFIDGSWLFKACAPEKALSYKLEYPDRAFPIDFGKLNQVLLSHAQKHRPDCVALGSLYFSTSIFSLPDDLDSWADERDDITEADVANVKRSVTTREKFSAKAIANGYSQSAIFRPRLKGWMINRLKSMSYQEKQVDATVVALMVKHAITEPDNTHVIVTGDADVLPAIRVAYPEYSENVLVATVHPDQLAAESRNTSFELADFNYAIPPLFIDQAASSIVEGEHVYSCAHCSKIFIRPRAIPPRALPCCHPCHQRRT